MGFFDYLQLLFVAGLPATGIFILGGLVADKAKGYRAHWLNVMFGLTLMTAPVAMLVSVAISSHQAYARLAPLISAFYGTADGEPLHTYAPDGSSRSATWDFGGSLDSIVEERDRITTEMGLYGIAVEWWTHDLMTTIRGTYVNLKWVGWCLAAWAVGLTAFLLTGFGERPTYQWQTARR